MSPFDDNWLGGLNSAEELMAHGDNLGALCQILREVGATVTFYGKPVSEEELRAGVEASALARITCLAQAMPVDPELDRPTFQPLRRHRDSRPRRKLQRK